MRINPHVALVTILFAVVMIRIGGTIEAIPELTAIPMIGTTAAGEEKLAWDPLRQGACRLASYKQVVDGSTMIIGAAMKGKEVESAADRQAETAMTSTEGRTISLGHVSANSKIDGFYLEEQSC